MESVFDPQIFYQWFEAARTWVMTHILVWENLVHIAVQAAVLLAVRLIGAVLGRWLRRAVKNRWGDLRVRQEYLNNFIQRLLSLSSLLLSILLLLFAITVVARFGYRTLLMKLVLNLSVAWVVIQLATSVILDRFWSRIVAICALALATLNIVGALDEAVALLDSIGFTVGEVKLTLLSLIKAAVILFILLRAVNWLGGQLERKLEKAPGLTPSSRLMLSKIVHITMIVLVGLIALNLVGINLTALAVFSGAIGVGIGFGLQKVVGNFISGLILLSDKSIKPGDVIELSGVYGWVKQMGGRCVSIVTRDEKEYLIPNEDLITQQVVNWSYSNRKIRIRTPIGISYNADPHRAISLIVEAARELPRILTDPEPKCLLKEFGDNSVDLELRFWIEDPQSGVANITSDVLLRVWDILKENEIEIPFPQRDVHLDVQGPLKVMHVSATDNPAGEDADEPAGADAPRP
ncbi:MAG: mechanosensitive ion channel [Desulfobacterales bacterium]|nr:mechanosensitive ion channel [Desulfobacterales bacterium]